MEPAFLKAKKIIQNFGEFVKKQQCKKATRVCKLIFFSDKTQRWTLDGTMLKNEEGVWKSDDLWIFKSVKSNHYSKLSRKKRLFV